MPWLGPIRKDDPTRDLTGGHPTAPGDNDEYVARAGAPDWFDNGRPGVPRVQPGPRHSAGFPMAFGRPMQPGTKYDGPEQ